jgi:hypothetical protein
MVMWTTHHSILHYEINTPFQNVGNITPSDTLLTPQKTGTLKITAYGIRHSEYWYIDGDVSV